MHIQEIRVIAKVHGIKTAKLTKVEPKTGAAIRTRDPASTTATESAGASWENPGAGAISARAHRAYVIRIARSPVLEGCQSEFSRLALVRTRIRCGSPRANT